MTNIFFSESVVQTELRKVLIEQLSHLGSVLFSKWSQSGNGSFFRQLIEFLNSCHSLVRSQTAEVNFDEFLWIKWAMEILSHWNGLRNANTCRVNGLPHILDVDSTGNFFNQNRSKSLWSKFLVDTQEVDFSHLDSIILLEMHVNRNSWNEAHKLFGLNDSHTYEPIFVLTRRRKSPLKEFSRVIETEHIVIIFNVVFYQ